MLKLGNCLMRTQNPTCSHPRLSTFIHVFSCPCQQIFHHSPLYPIQIQMVPFGIRQGCTWVQPTSSVKQYQIMWAGSRSNLLDNWYLIWCIMDSFANLDLKAFPSMLLPNMQKLSAPRMLSRGHKVKLKSVRHETYLGWVNEISHGAWLQMRCKEEMLFVN